MGCRTSPFIAVRANLIGEETVRGDRQDVSNPFRWNEYRLNLPGQSTYNRGVAWGAKVRRSRVKQPKRKQWTRKNGDRCTHGHVYFVLHQKRTMPRKGFEIGFCKEE